MVSNLLLVDHSLINFRRRYRTEYPLDVYNNMFIYDFFNCDYCNDDGEIVYLMRFHRNPKLKDNVLNRLLNDNTYSLLTNDEFRELAIYSKRTRPGETFDLRRSPEAYNIFILINELLFIISNPYDNRLQPQID